MIATDLPKTAFQDRRPSAQSRPKADITTRSSSKKRQLELIEEFFGRINSSDSVVSIARMRSPKDWFESDQHLSRIGRMRENGIRTRHKRRYMATTNSEYSLSVTGIASDVPAEPNQKTKSARNGSMRMAGWKTENVTHLELELDQCAYW